MAAYVERMTPHPLQPYWTDKANAAMQEQRLKGRHLGKAPLGYRNVVVDGKPYIVIDPETAPLVREAFRLAAKKKMSLRKILAELEKQGFRTKTGKPLGVSSLHKVLGNAFYTGFINHMGVPTKATHEGIIMNAIFNKVQLNLREPSRST
jgi:site-specific DNA recombinase